MLEVECGSFEYVKGRSILHNIRFFVKPGEILAILGPNGAGKTTLLKCINGVHTWKQGCLTLNGEILHPKNIPSTIAYVPQSHTVTFPYSVSQMVLFGLAPKLGFFSLPSEKDQECVASILHKLKISHLASHSCAEISGGELQLVLIARALISKPKVILLDEPESHLDFKNQIIILNLLRELTDNEGLICIFNTHFPDHALQIADRILMIGKDSFIFGTTEEVITEETLLTFFGVRVGFVTYHSDSHGMIQAMIPLGLGEDE